MILQLAALAAAVKVLRSPYAPEYAWVDGVQVSPPPGGNYCCCGEYYGPVVIRWKKGKPTKAIRCRECFTERWA